MNILSYENKNGALIITTDYKDIPVWVYPEDKFKNIVDLKKEIEKKIREIEKKSVLKIARKETLFSELDVEVNKNA